MAALPRGSPTSRLPIKPRQPALPFKLKKPASVGADSIGDPRGSAARLGGSVGDAA